MIPTAPMQEKETLAILLTLEADGEEIQLFPNDIHQLDLQLFSYGYQAKLGISSFDNPDLNTMLEDTKVIKATLAFYSTDPEKEGDDPVIEIKGTLLSNPTDQRVNSLQEEAEEEITLWELIFQDHAQTMWSEHYPQNIYVDKTMKDVFDEHKNPDITLNYEWDELEEEYPILAFSLEEKGEIPEWKRSNFYHFFHWYLHKKGGIVTYDYKEVDYTLLKEKKPLEGDPFSIKQTFVTPPRRHRPRVVRSTIRTLDHKSDELGEEVEEGENVHENVRKDYTDESESTLYPDHKHGKVESPLHPEKMLLSFSVKEFQEEFQLDKILPGSFINFENYPFPSSFWSQDPAYQGNNFRIRNLTFKAERLTPINGIETHTQPYNIKIEVWAEHEEELHIERPEFNPPIYPFTTKGKVSSEIGENDKHMTFQVEEGETTPFGHYFIKTPLANDEKVIIPFLPCISSAQYYFPHWKDTDVELSVFFDKAKISRILQFADRAKLPPGTQGNQVVLASKDNDVFCTVTLIYEDDENPVYIITLSSSPEQKQVIRVEKELIKLLVELEGKQSTTFEMKNALIHYILEDKESKMTQETIFDGKQMKHTCKQEGDESICIQKPDSFAFQSKKFSIKADESIDFDCDILNLKAKSKSNTESKLINLKAPSVKQG